MDYLIPSEDLVLIYKEKKLQPGWFLSFLQTIKKESQKIDKYLDLAGELKMLKNMSETETPIVVDALGMVFKGLIKGLEEL